MAETYSAEWTTLYRTTPPGNVFGYNVDLNMILFNVLHTANGTADDTTLLVRVPPKSRIVVPLCWLKFTGFAVSTTLDMGYKAYYDVNGVLVPEDADALIDGLDIDADGQWGAGSALAATAIAGVVDLNNRDEVWIFVTYRTTAPGSGDLLTGGLALANP